MLGKGIIMFEESLNCELKQEYTEDIKKTVVAFANSDGGDIYIGVEDDGKVCGIKNTDEIFSFPGYQCWYFFNEKIPFPGVKAILTYCACADFLFV